jgi:DNA polymerase III delta prime subunit
METRLFIQKYQPLYLKDFCLDEEIERMIETLMGIDNLNLLLIGDIGSGKTTLLNSLIREYYRGYSPKEYEENVLYINNLKEQGINYYRTDVKIFCQTCSMLKNKKKIIVLDDIDMINEQSQQVFRNCIDKYSHNVHFISSCNNIQKVIESLQSRFTIIKLKQIKREKLIELMNRIQKSENIEIAEDARDFIINISNNTVKILIHYMEKFKLLNEPITLPLANHLCSNISFLIFEEYTEYILDKNLEKALQLIYEVYDKGYSLMDIFDNYFIFVKMTAMIDEETKFNFIQNICKYITVFHNIHEHEIELALFTKNLIETV